MMFRKGEGQSTVCQKESEGEHGVDTVEVVSGAEGDIYMIVGNWIHIFIKHWRVFFDVLLGFYIDYW